MHKAIIALVLLAVAAMLMLITGCSAPAPEQKDTQETQETQETATGADDSQITGVIQDVDNMDAELNDPELEKTDSYLDEVKW
ncbi:hypothetical protein JW756_03530 [Candidatus Woesearchaeota archaeon]|nr:hypothetical protein [Candidatus Woesearchaeota archaeon]